MARPQKKGIDYFSFDVGFFDDRKIRELRGKFGSDGITVYIYLLCLIYKENGYYIELDDGFDYVASADLNMNSEKIGQIINFLCRRSLFDDKLFTSDKVLTSRSIQLRFQEAVKIRASKKEILVNKFWVLKKDETQSYIKCADFRDLSEKNGSYSEKNCSLSLEKPTKKSKVKESKVKKRKEADAFFSQTMDRLMKYYSERIGEVTQEVYDSFAEYLNTVDESMITYAIDEAVKRNAKTLMYINGIIKTQIKAGNRTHPDEDFNVYKDETGYDYGKVEEIMQRKYDGGIT